ncbi:coiled coil protein [Legionella quinlivanii]|uniref:Coiled coil protein n=1 Tax=Legionella quinlivanii TaxID=45073 RepID=A0A0W0Y5I5_9GAMM|nr:hypothetical protein [Legionella quinlivanii]KTD51892.1 coiled coil protein [Legionella quinlivanii]SEF84048.1 hypothetical protein SAMN02746093_01197 [Legionella quinlivanii DSM 21216]STY09646.1 coiled coil protein [Legionella quinlivanii]
MSGSTSNTAQTEENNKKARENEANAALAAEASKAKMAVAPVAPAKGAAPEKDDKEAPAAEEGHFFSVTVDKNAEPMQQVVQELLNMVLEMNQMTTDFAETKLKGAAQGAKELGGQALDALKPKLLSGLDAIKNFVNPPPKPAELPPGHEAKPTPDAGLSLGPRHSITMDEMEEPEDIIGSSYLYNSSADFSDTGDSPDLGDTQAPKADMSSVMLHDPEQQKTVELTAEKLQTWLNKVDITPAPEGENPSIKLGKQGLQQAKDVINFLNTPAGDTTKEKVAAELMQAVEQEKAREEMQREELLQQQRLAAFLVHIAQQDEDKIAERNIQIQEAIDQKIQQDRQHQLADTDSASVKAEKEAELDARIDAYDAQIGELQQSIDSLNKDIEATNREIERLEKNTKTIDAKHDAYQASADKVKKYDPKDPAERAKIEKGLADLKKEIAKDMDKIAEEAGTVSPEQTKADIAKVNAKQVEVAATEDMLAVYKGEKSAYKADGTPTSDFNDTAYVAPKGKSILKGDDGSLYLVNKDVTDVNSLSASQKQQASSDFNRAKGQMTSVEDVIKNNRSGEHGLNNQQLGAARQTQQTQLSQLSEMRMQIQKAQEEKTQTQQERNNLRNPSPAPGNSRPLSKAEVDQATTVFNKMLNRVADKYSDGGIQALQNQVVNTFGKNPQTDALLKQIPQGQPIDPANIRQLTQQFRSCGTTPDASMQATAEADQQNQQRVGLG